MFLLDDWSQVGLKQNARDMIEEVVWNTGTLNLETFNYATSNITPLEYQWERSDFTGKQCSQGGNYCNDEVERKTIWEGKVGLMYPSDYGYAVGLSSKTDRNTCLYNSLALWKNWNYCYDNDWLFNSRYYQWTMTPAPYSTTSNSVFYIEYDRGGGDPNPRASVTSSNTYYSKVVRPVVYLKSSVKITGGTGTSEEPYTLSF